MRLERWMSPSGKTRWITTFDRAEARSYAAAVALAFPRPAMGPRSFAAPGGPGRPWRAARLAWRRAVTGDLATAELVIVSDVADCYATIGEPAIRMAIRRAGGVPEPLLAQLANLGASGVHGVPVGPSPSAAVCEAVLSIADARASAAGAPPIRWVDDVVFAGDRDVVLRAARAWTAALEELGLREHEAKRGSFRTGGRPGAVIGPPSLAGRDRRGIIPTS